MSQFSWLAFATQFRTGRLKVGFVVDRLAAPVEHTYNGSSYSVYGHGPGPGPGGFHGYPPSPYGQYQQPQPHHPHLHPAYASPHPHSGFHPSAGVAVGAAPVENPSGPPGPGSLAGYWELFPCLLSRSSERRLLLRKQNAHTHTKCSTVRRVDSVVVVRRRLVRRFVTHQHPGMISLPQ